MNRDEGFVSRWARRKAQVRAGRVPDDPPAAALPVPPVPPVPPQAPDVPALPGTAGAPGARSAAAVAAPLAATEPLPAAAAAAQNPAAQAPAPAPLPTLDDVAALASDAKDFSRFVAPQVSTEVRNAAMKKLFADPHFNLMDGLDVYIDDYSQPDPIPASMLRSLVQSKVLGLFADDAETAASPGAAVPSQRDAAAAVPPATAALAPADGIVDEGLPADAGADLAAHRVADADDSPDAEMPPQEPPEPAAA